MFIIKWWFDSSILPNYVKSVVRYVRKKCKNFLQKVIFFVKFDLFGCLKKLKKKLPNLTENSVSIGEFLDLVCRKTEKIFTELVYSDDLREKIYLAN